MREALVDELRARADDLRAVGFVHDLQTEGIRAILVEFEHRDGTSLSTWIPYMRKRRRGPVVFGELQASDGHPKLWAPGWADLPAGRLGGLLDRHVLEDVGEPVLDPGAQVAVSSTHPELIGADGGDDHVGDLAGSFPEGPVMPSLFATRHCSASGVRCSRPVSGGRFARLPCTQCRWRSGQSTLTPIGAPEIASSWRNVSEIETTAGPCSRRRARCRRRHSTGLRRMRCSRCARAFPGGA